MTPDEVQLVRRCHARLPGSFDELYASYGERVYRFCRRLTSTTADAEDLTQDVFVAAFSGRERFAGRSSIATWLLRIAVFRWRASTRRRRVDTVGLLERDLPERAGADPADGEVARLGLAHALDQLPLDQRETFILVRAEGLTCREAAQVLGIPEGTLKFRVYRAAERLRDLLIEPAELKTGRTERPDA